MIMRSEEMSEQQRAPAFLGARTIKTGIAVVLALFLSQYVPYSLPLLAAVAAVLCMQPSITAGVQKGFIRIKGTILGGLLGLALLYIFGSNLLLIGAAVIVVICICKQLRWEEGISLASISIIAVMVRVSVEAFPYAAGRVISTIIGIIVATLINIVVAPPRHQITFREGIRQITTSFPHIYEKAIEAYACNRLDLAEQVLKELGKAQTGVESLRRELSHLKIGTQTPLGTLLEGIELDEYLLFDRGVHFLADIIAKMEDIVDVIQRRYERKLELEYQGKLWGSHSLTPEFSDLLAVLRDLVIMLGELHQNVFHLVVEHDLDVMPRIQQKVEKICGLKELVRERLKYWQVEHIEDLDTFSLMSAHRVIFDLEEITIALTDLAKAVVKANSQL
jgi:hypothetical protein